MIVKLYATLRREAGAAEVEADAATAGELLDALAARHGPLFRAEGSILLVDGVNVQLLQGDDTPLPEGARIELFPPLGGG